MIATLEQPATNLRDYATDRRPLNWREIAAKQLLAETDEELPSHEDLWINDLARLYFIGLRNSAFALTAQQRSIRDAALLKESGSLAAEVLEARLLAGLPPDWIAHHSSLRLDVIVAYSALYFDVRLPNPKHRWLQTGMLTKLNADNRTVWELGTFLKRTGIMLGPAVMEHSIRLLAELTGPTLADGMAVPGATTFVSDVFVRGSIAGCLIRSPRQAQRLQVCLSQFRQACNTDTVPAAALIEIFQKVKITKSLKAQFQQLRSSIEQ